MTLLSKALLQGRREATLFYHYQYQREQRVKRDESAYGILEKVLTTLQNTDSRDPLPWQAVAGEAYSHETVLWDIAELYDFIPGGQND
jgi:hypothetical protein